MTKQINCHRLVAEVAVGLTEIDYDRNASDNTFYHLNPDRRAWVKQMAGLHINDARDLLYLTAMDDGTSESEKQRIWTALVLDEQIPGAERRVMVAQKQAIKQEIQKITN